MNFLYLIGAPGAGKSTLVAKLTEGLMEVRFPKPIPYIVWGEPPGPARVIEMGGRRENFSGTDVMAMNIHPRAKAFVEARPANLMIAEGDRLANDSFFETVKATGYNLDVVYLDTPEEIAEAWRRDRAAEIGKRQSESWVKGRATKARNLAEKWNAQVITAVDLDARVAALSGHPVADALTL